MCFEGRWLQPRHGARAAPAMSDLKAPTYEYETVVE
jgi:hypothetical protein